MRHASVRRGSAGRLLLAVLAPIALIACADDPPPVEAPRISGPQLTCVRGSLSNEGVECPLFVDDAGTRWSLMGDIGWLRPGLPGCVCGEPVDISFCMQGRPLTVAQIGAAEDCAPPRPIEE